MDACQWQAIDSYTSNQTLLLKQENALTWDAEMLYDQNPAKDVEPSDVGRGADGRYITGVEWVYHSATVPVEEIDTLPYYAPMTTAVQ